MRQFVPTNVRTIPTNAKCVFRGVIFDVYHWEQKMFDGSTETFEMLKRPDTVDVIAVKDGKIIVLEEEQPGRGPYHAFPGGRHDVENENELQAAQREMEEETGMTFANWKLISAVQPHVKIDWIAYTFVATDFVVQTEQKLDVGEKIKVTPMTIEEIKELNKDPGTRHLQRELFYQVNSIQELLALPDFSE